MNRWLPVMLILTVVAVGSGITIDTSGRYLEPVQGISGISFSTASAAGMEAGLAENGQGRMSGDEKTESGSAISLSGQDRDFVLFVFIGSIAAAVASIVSMTIKTRRSKQEGGMD